MATLTEILISDAKRTAVIDDCCELIDAEVAHKSGLAGLAIKAGYGAVKGIKPGFIRQVVTDLLPEFSTALDPIFQEAKTQSKPVGEYLVANCSRAADALLGITDAKAQRSKSTLIKGTYEKLRASAKKNVEAAIPRVGALLQKQAG